MREQTRINPTFITEQVLKRKDLEAAPSMAGGLPELKSRLAIVEEILALHSYALPAQP